MDERAVVVVDDLRVFPGLDATYLRSLDEARAWWTTYQAAPYPVELWLDHDLGGYEGEDTVRPLVASIEERLMAGPLPLSVRIVTDNPAGHRWLRGAFEGRVPVNLDVPRWRLANRSSE
jgi:hypothetical protein